jgi:hypothetical protein
MHYVTDFELLLQGRFAAHGGHGEFFPLKVTFRGISHIAFTEETLDLNKNRNIDYTFL